MAQRILNANYSQKNRASEIKTNYQPYNMERSQLKSRRYLSSDMYTSEMKNKKVHCLNLDTTSLMKTRRKSSYNCRGNKHTKKTQTTKGQYES